MSRINNTRIVAADVTTILVTKDDDPSYLRAVKVDTEDSERLSKVRVNNRGYAVVEGKKVDHAVMGHSSNMDTVIDHINGDKLDNRKENLRVLSQPDNANNRHSSRNNTGTVGIAKRTNGNYTYFRATVSDRRQPVTERGDSVGLVRNTPSSLTSMNWVKRRL